MIMIQEEVVLLWTTYSNMNRTEIAQCLDLLSVAYPNFKVGNPELLINLWSIHFGSTPAKLVSNAINMIIHENTSQFAPTIGEIVQKVETLKEDRITIEEAKKLLSMKEEFSDEYILSLVIKCRLYDIETVINDGEPRFVKFIPSDEEVRQLYYNKRLDDEERNRFYQLCVEAKERSFQAYG